MKNRMERLRFMQGEWHVQASIVNEQGQWIATSIPNETTILSILGGLCHREEMPVAYNEVIVRLFFSWSYDKHRNIFRMISCDDQTGLMDIMEGDFLSNSDTVVIDNTRTGLPSSFRQLASTKNSENSFTDIVSESYDKGLSWTPVFRAIHIRK